ncbi:hypothetical protein GCM10010885_23960 [Alicyclobacillus cellulosilyticus]|uniref:Enterochelin esterase-like enzyme n=1 Tax=Alicyclobacillus cellulosilyticus TaxID=1003997 RepID=A0A917KH44_9BACL|nr:alpha/beta hydrolase-fold protein [Alicyclobacillus cellulosilyticus]GGJ13810.1 hypothetical protein GCM10010885_23960 [Alicyclobacillus cellulosilyticus]
MDNMPPAGVRPRRIIETHTLYSVHLQEDRTIKVFLPPGYPQAAPYAVLYCHDGNEFFTHGRIATIATERMQAGALQPLVIVGMAVNLARRTDDYAVDGVRHEAYVRFVAEECRPWVETRYAVRRDPAGRFMAGVSLGALASVSIHARHPDLWRKLLLFSGAFTPDAVRWLERMPSFSEMAAYMVVGDEETRVETQSGVFDFYHGHFLARDLFLSHGADIDARVAPGKHVWGFWQRQLPEALDWLDRHRG